MWLCPKCKNKNDSRELKCIACGRTRFNKMTSKEKQKYEIDKLNRSLFAKGIDPTVPCHIISERKPIPHGFSIPEDLG